MDQLSQIQKNNTANRFVVAFNYIKCVKLHSTVHSDYIILKCYSSVMVFCMVKKPLLCLLFIKSAFLPLKNEFCN